SSRSGGQARGNQVWVLERSGGEARQLTHLPGRITSYDWSPDGTRLVLVYREAEGAEAETARAASGATPAPPKPIVVDKYQFKRDGQKYLTGNARTRIYLYDVQS